jgi:uncharacterized protein YndB with AHSA1/START domain
MANFLMRHARTPSEIYSGSKWQATTWPFFRLDRIAHHQEYRMKITVSTIVAAPIAEAWRAYTSPEDIKQWNAASSDWHTTAASVDLREGGAFSSRMEAKDGSMGFDFAGTYTQVIPLERIDSAFGDRTSQVTFASTPAGTEVTIVFDAENAHPEQMQRDGWQAILDNFKRHVEAGSR